MLRCACYVDVIDPEVHVRLSVLPTTDANPTLFVLGRETI
jgi:hypothetical protein